MGGELRAGNLNVIWCLDEVCALDRAVWNDTRAVVALRAPRNLDALCVADIGLWPRFRRCEEAKVGHRVYYSVK
jgi:hypothetical protein